jgi:hypothetical protein
MQFHSLSKSSNAMLSKFKFKSKNAVNAVLYVCPKTPSLC